MGRPVYFGVLRTPAGAFSGRFGLLSLAKNEVFCVSELGHVDVYPVSGEGLRVFYRNIAPRALNVLRGVLKQADALSALLLVGVSGGHAYVLREFGYWVLALHLVLVLGRTRLAFRVVRDVVCGVLGGYLLEGRGPALLVTVSGGLLAFALCALLGFAHSSVFDVLFGIFSAGLGGSGLMCFGVFGCFWVCGVALVALCGLDPLRLAIFDQIRVLCRSGVLKLHTALLILEMMSFHTTLFIQRMVRLHTTFFILGMVRLHAALLVLVLGAILQTGSRVAQNDLVEAHVQISRLLVKLLALGPPVGLAQILHLSKPQPPSVGHGPQASLQRTAPNNAHGLILSEVFFEQLQNLLVLKQLPNLAAFYRQLLAVLAA